MEVVTELGIIKMMNQLVVVAVPPILLQLMDYCKLFLETLLQF